MAVMAHDTNTCAVCGGTPVIGMDAGTVLCVACGTEYDPNNPPPPTLHEVGEVVAEVVAQLETGAPPAATAAEVAETETRTVAVRPSEVDAPDDGGSPLDAFVGQDVVLDDGTPAIVRDFPDDDHVRVELPNGRKVTVEIDAVRPVAPDAHPIDAALANVDEVGAYELGETVLAVAEQVISAGIASLEGEGADAVLVTPPGGWLPDDPDTIPLLEQGAAVAVAMLLRAFDLPRDVIADAIAAARVNAREGGQQLEEVEHADGRGTAEHEHESDGAADETGDVPGGRDRENQGESVVRGDGGIRGASDGGGNARGGD